MVEREKFKLKVLLLFKLLFKYPLYFKFNLDNFLTAIYLRNKKNQVRSNKQSDNLFCEKNIYVI